ncbi:MAG: hypothetical protein NVSMB52_11820 [Chloroflexota bacterium]
MNVKDHTVPSSATISPQDTLVTASNTLEANGTRSLTVCEEGRPVGILTASAISSFATDHGLATGSTLVEAIMSRDFPQVRANDDMESVMRQYAERADDMEIPVVDDQGLFVGTISRPRLHANTDTSKVGSQEGVDADEAHHRPRGNTVDAMSDESFPASDPPPTQAHTDNTVNDG